MDLDQAEDWLIGLESFGMRFGLDRMHRLMTALGMPQRRFASIHVVGTNGKSSTVRMIAAILERHGLRTGAYLSPHLTSFTERVLIGGEPVGSAELAGALTRARQASELVNRTLEPGDVVTQFEALTAAAYHELARARVEVAVVEAGLGGRYDATNVIPSRVQVLTGVDLDHTRWLGETIEEIAEEKLAVVPDHGVLVTGPLPAPAEAVARRVVSERHAEWRRVSSEDEASVPELAVRGRFQRRNFALARAAAAAFIGEVDQAKLAAAAGELRAPGRLEVTGQDPIVIRDAAHNPAGARALAESLPELLAGRPLTLLAAVLADKDVAGVLAPLLPLAERVLYTNCQNPRCMSPEELAEVGARLGGPAGEVVAEPHAALERACELAGRGGAVLATGSIYLMADLARPLSAGVAERRASSL